MASERDGVGEGCGLTDNVWLVLLDGAVLDVTGSKDGAVASAELLLEFNRAVGRQGTVEAVRATTHYS